MSTNTDLSCRNIGIIVKNYNNINQSLQKNIGDKHNKDKDLWGLPIGRIADPYFEEDNLSKGVSIRTKYFDYLDYIRTAVDSAPSFDNYYSLITPEQLKISTDTVSEGDWGDYSLSDILNGIQNFTQKNNTGYGSAYSKLYSLHSQVDEGVGAWHNYNMNSPKPRVTLMQTYGYAYRGISFMDGMLRWATDGAFANYARISERTSIFDFTEAHYGYGLNAQFGSNGMSYVGMKIISDIDGPLDRNDNGLDSIERLDRYRSYYEDLGWKSKYFYSKSMWYTLNGPTKKSENFDLLKSFALDPEVAAGDATSNNELPDTISFYPFNRRYDIIDGENFGMNMSVVYDKYKHEYSKSYTTYKRQNSMSNTTDIYGSHIEYAEADGDYDRVTDDTNFDTRIDHLNNDTNEYVSQYGDYGTGAQGIAKANGQEHGIFLGRASHHQRSKDLVDITNEAFKNGMYQSLVARFHTPKTEETTQAQDVQSSYSETYGLSHGRNLLIKNHESANNRNTNTYDNPYCRVWTYHHQYHTFQNLIRGGSDEQYTEQNDNGTYSQVDYGNGGVFDESYDAGGKLGDQTRSGKRDYSFRATYAFSGSKDSSYFSDGQDSLNNLSVLNHTNGLVNITPKDASEDLDLYGDKQRFDIKRCMFSIENLAWRDNYLLLGKGNSLSYTLDDKQIGPLGGRIMWFPPYGIDFSENLSAQWENAGDFIGRGEPLKTYKNATRSATLSFKILIDHPSIIDYIDKESLGNENAIGTGTVDDTGSTEQTLLRFFAGCDYLTPKPIPLVDKLYKKKNEKVTYTTVTETTYELSNVPVNTCVSNDGSTVSTGSTSVGGSKENCSETSVPVKDTNTVVNKVQPNAIFVPVFFPNNYSAYEVESGDTKAISEKWGDVGSNPKNCFENDVELVNSVMHSTTKDRYERTEQNLLYLLKGIGTQCYSSKSWKNFKFTGDEKSNCNSKTSSCYYGKYRQLYQNNITVKDDMFADAFKYTSSSNIHYIPLSMYGELKVKKTNEQTEFKLAEDINSDIKTLTNANSEYYSTANFFDNPSFGYEMNSGDCGISNCGDLFRYYNSPSSSNKALSACITPVFMVVEDENGTIYDMPTIWGRWQGVSSTNEGCSSSGSYSDAYYRNEWMYRIDQYAYRRINKKIYNQSVSKAIQDDCGGSETEFIKKAGNSSYQNKLLNKAFIHNADKSTISMHVYQQEVMRLKPDNNSDNSAYWHKDYSDRKSFGLNSRLGIGTVAEKLKNVAFYKTDKEGNRLGDETYDINNFSKNDAGQYVIEADGKSVELVPFADFMIACWLVKHESAENLSNLDSIFGKLKNINSDTYDKNCIQTLVSLLKKENIDDSNCKLIGTASSAGQVESNNVLAFRRSQAIVNYVSYILGLSDEEKSKFFANRPWLSVSPASKLNASLDDDVSELNPKFGRMAGIYLEFKQAEKEETSQVAQTENQIAEIKAVAQDSETTETEKEEKLNTMNETSYKYQYKEVKSTKVVPIKEEYYEDAVSDMMPQRTRYEDEYGFFKTIQQKSPLLRSKIQEKIKYFDPAFHAVSPEGFNARLTFLHQCTRQGPTFDATNSNNASNLAFGRPPVCVLRLGDFFYSRILINSISIKYDDMLWDLNPEGAGVQPMLATVSLSFDVIGGQDLGGPISRLQNAVSFNYYANARVYDDRAEQIKYDENDKNPEDFKFVPNMYQ